MMLRADYVVSVTHIVIHRNQPPDNNIKAGNNINHAVVLDGQHATDQPLAEF